MIRTVLLVGACMALASCVTSHDQAYEKAEVYGPERPHAVALFLHGCGGGTEWEWLQLLIDQGFLVVHPDSFADPRPASSCAPPWPNKKQIMDLRRRQTNHALAQIRLEHPDKKIVVWGHSEGGVLANFITEPVAGIITTGYRCGYRFYGGTHIPKDIPLLVIIGADDGFVRRTLKRTIYASFEAHCKATLKSPKHKFIVIEGAGHRPALRIKKFRQAVEDFLSHATAG